MLQAFSFLLEKEFSQVNLFCERNLNPQVFITAIPALYDQKQSLDLPKSRKYLNLLKSRLPLKYVFLKTSEPNNTEGVDQETVRSGTIFRAGIPALTLCFWQTTHLPGFVSLHVISIEDGNAYFPLFLKGTQNKHHSKGASILHVYLAIW